MLNSMAVKKPLTEKPLTTEAANKISKAFITKVNSPRVKILIGKVIKIKTGLTKTLIMPKNKASHKAVQNPATATPGIKYELIIMAKTITSHFNIMDINFLLFPNPLFIYLLFFSEGLFQINPIMIADIQKIDKNVGDFVVKVINFRILV